MKTKPEYQVEIGGPNTDMPIMDVDNFRAARALIEEYHGGLYQWAYIIRDGQRIRRYACGIDGQWHMTNQVG